MLEGGEEEVHGRKGQSVTCVTLVVNSNSVSHGLAYWSRGERRGEGAGINLRGSCPPSRTVSQQGGPTGTEEGKKMCSVGNQKEMPRTETVLWFRA